MYLYGIFQRHGTKGLSVAAAALGACMFFLVLGACRVRGVPAGAAAVPVALAAVAARTRIAPRPELFGLLCACLFLYVISKYLDSGEDDERARKIHGERIGKSFYMSTEFCMQQEH